MLSFSVLLCTLVVLICYRFQSTTATNVVFVNNCGHNIELVKTANGQAPVKECDLAPGAQCSKSYDNNGMNFKHGWGGKGITLAEFSWNSWNGLDFYDLSVIEGYNVPMQIRPSDGNSPTVTCGMPPKCVTFSKENSVTIWRAHFNCNGPQCPDAYLFPKDDTKTHGTRTGGTFTVTLCPAQNSGEDNEQ